MGFFGGGSSTSKEGFAALPKQMKVGFDNLSRNVQFLTSPYTFTNKGKTLNQSVLDMFTPLGQTTEEGKALQMVNAGMAPTQESLQSDIAMQMNPFDQYVIDEINRQGQGDYSVLKQELANAGQFGSNRAALGANDIDMARMGQIGQFKQSQFNNAMNNALTVMPQLRQQDISNLFNAGDFLRGQNTAQKQVPISALTTQAQLMGAVPQDGGRITTTKSGGGFGSLMSGLTGASQGLSSLGSIASAIGGFFSDRSLKTDISYIGKENGHNVYRFKYKNNPHKEFIGVIAQEVQETNPDAVMEVDGYLAVNYDAIGVEFREIA